MRDHVLARGQLILANCREHAPFAASASLQRGAAIHEERLAGDHRR